MPDEKKAARLRDLKESARDLLMIDPNKLLIEKGHNPRDYNLPENHDHLDELKDQIRQAGKVLVPLLVRFDKANGEAYVVDGECRLRAVLELIAEGEEIVAVPVVQVGGNNAGERLATAMMANTGKPFSKIEYGMAFARFIGYGWTEDRINERLGFSKRFITEALSLQDAPDEVKQMIAQEAITPSLAISELRKSGTASVENLRKAATEARSKGKKTAKRTKSNPVPNPKRLLKLVIELVESCEDELFDEGSERYVEVDKSTVKKLADLAGIFGKQKKTA